MPSNILLSHTMLRTILVFVVIMFSNSVFKIITTEDVTFVTDGPCIIITSELLLGIYKWQMITNAYLSILHGKHFSPQYVD